MVELNRAKNTLGVQKSRGLRGIITLPGDKSISHRAYMLAALSDGPCTIYGGLSSGDGAQTLEALCRLGIAIASEKGGQIHRIHGRGLRGLRAAKAPIPCGRSGTSMRLLAGILAGQRGQFILAGDAQLHARPMARIIDPLRAMGANIRGERANRYPPLTIVGGSLNSFHYELPIASAQVKSALLLAGLVSGRPVHLREPGPSRDHSELLLNELGVPIGGGPLESIYDGGVDRISPFEMRVPGDISSAAFLVVGALIVPDSELVLRGVGLNPRRIGLLSALRRMGGDIEIRDQRVQMGEVVGDLRIRHSRLHGVEVSGKEVVTLIDEIPILAVAAACAEGQTVISDAAELRVKESDRIHSIVSGLSKMGAQIEAKADGMIIQGGPLMGAEIHTFEDHRIVMAMMVAALAAQGPSQIDGAGYIADSFPGCIETIQEVSR